MTTNLPAQTTDDLIHAALFDVAYNAAMTALQASNPWLRFPLFSIITGAILKAMAGKLYTALAQLVVFSVVDFQTSAQKTDYQNAEAALRSAHLSGDPDALAKAQDLFRTAASRLISFDGTAH